MAMGLWKGGGWEEVHMGDSGSFLRWWQGGGELCDHRTGTTYIGNVVGRRMQEYSGGGKG